MWHLVLEIFRGNPEKGLLALSIHVFLRKIKLKMKTTYFFSSCKDNGPKLPISSISYLRLGEAFSKMLEAAGKENLIQGIKPASQGPTISHM